MRDSFDPEQLVFIDETGIRTNCTPRYGWSERGKPCIGNAPGSWKSYSTVAAISLAGVGMATTVEEGAFNKASGSVHNLLQKEKPWHNGRVS